jgi:Protein of unknown function (DUF1822)
MIEIIADRALWELSSPSPATAYSTPGGTQRARLNQQCLTAMTDWLQTEFDLTARVYPSPAALPSFWEVVTGTAITVNAQRLVLIPSVAITVDELRVPQEWVDIPAWAADYYLAIQVDPDQGTVAVVGYSSHDQLKTMGSYEAADRTYALDTDDLWQDLKSLFISWQLMAAPVARAAVGPLPFLPQAQAHRLLERLGHPALTFPRRAVPFPQWAALLDHGGWRQRLYERRQGQQQEASLAQWMGGALPVWARQVGWQPRDFAGAGVRSLQSGLAKPLVIAGEPYELRVVALEPSAGLSEGLRTWRVELRSARSGGAIPIGFRLRLLTEDLQMMDHNEDGATAVVERLFVDVMLEPGEGLVWEVEPTPEDYDREILRF